MMTPDTARPTPSRSSFLSGERFTSGGSVPGADLELRWRGAFFGAGLLLAGVFLGGGFLAGMGKRPSGMHWLENYSTNGRYFVSGNEGSLIFAVKKAAFGWVSVPQTRARSPTQMRPSSREFLKNRI
jgi:hypothetical protein